MLKVVVQEHMSSAADTVENASIISESTAHDGNRLWIGNIDPKITEYHLVKLLEKFGNVKQFDFLFHKSGPLEGQPRGYCFVNFNTREEAERAIQCLNGKLALSKKLVVRWAHAQVRRFEGFRNDKTMPPSLEPSCSGSTESGSITTSHLRYFSHSYSVPPSRSLSSTTIFLPTIFSH
ncbi:probable RNA-binding protein 18 isoform X4 [Melanotaenia boesemani]|uniref:probable RNA-binding protein 18 isoform X4 n=1 Tax=Melanotaenia boesemani TaxID=1250792 RepID=UPI001C05801C|nr:probable RNA-binding protein 18 isoform X4 [Melanotaenia boesemani]